MGVSWQQEQFENYKINFDDSKQTVSMAINEVFNELILDVLKQVSIL